MPKLAGEPPVTLCLGPTGEEHDMCRFHALEMRAKIWPLAWRGDYQAARNMAYCLGDSCGGAVTTNPIQACAWRIVVLVSGDPEVDQSDTRNMDRACDRLEQAERVAAEASAKRISEAVF